MINIKKAIFGSRDCILGCQCDEHNDDKFVRMPRKKERMTKQKEHRSMMVGILVYILVLTVLAVTASVYAEDAEVLSGVALMDESEIPQDETLLKPKTASSGSGKGTMKNSGKGK